MTYKQSSCCMAVIWCS